MQIKSRFVRFLTIIFLAVCGVLSLVVLEIFGTTSKPVQVPVPANARWMVRIDAASILKEEFYALFFDAKDEQLLRAMREMIEERVQKESENPPLYINFRSDMVFYGIADRSVNYIGVLLQLENAELFQRNIPVYLEEGQTVAVRGNTALLMMHTGPEKIPAGQQQLFTENCLNNGKLSAIAPKSPELNEWINLEAKAFGESGKDLKTGLFFGKDALRVTGSFTADAIRTPAYSLKAKGLFLSTSIIPTGLADSINKLLPLGSYRFPELRAITLDYNGIIVENTDQGIKALPKMNAIFEGKVPISVANIRASIPGEYLGPKNTIVFSSLTYQMKQLDERTVFIGLDSNSIQSEKQVSLFRLEGPMQPLADIEGHKMIISLMEIVVPQLKPARAFIKKTKNVSLTVRSTQPNGTSYSISGVLQFREDAFALNEVTRLLIGMKLLQ